VNARTALIEDMGARLGVLLHEAADAAKTSWQATQLRNSAERLRAEIDYIARALNA
jgi:hypothetical protein